MIEKWENAKSKLNYIFTNDEVRGKIRGKLLKMDMKNRLVFLCLMKQINEN